MAIFTVSLARSTKIAAQAAKLSADALPSLERAYVFVEVSWSFDKAATHEGRTPDHTNLFRGEWAIINIGRTPAIIKGIERHVELLPSDEEPDNTRHVPNFTIAGGQMLLRTDGQFGKTVDRAPLIDDAGDRALTEGRAFIWFYGSVLYEDVFRIERRSSFRWKYTRSANHFGPSGGAPYNERT